MQSNPGKVVTKYQFSELLSKAWNKTMTPSTICAGFKKSGVFPFNPEAIDCGVSVNETHVLGQVVGAKIGEVDKEGNREPPVFSAEQQLLFQTRYEEGYD